MYQIKRDGAVIGYSDTVVFIRLHENGCYVPCEREKAEGFCVKVAIDSKDADTGKTVTRLEDFVYKFSDNGLLGIEPTAEVETVSGAIMLAKAETLQAQLAEIERAYDEQ